MIKISNGYRTIEVTSGAYESIFKRQGYKPVGKKSAKTEVEPEVTEEVTEEVATEDAEKPLDKWTSAEIKEYAAENGIDLTGTKNAKEARELIAAHMA